MLHLLRLTFCLFLAALLFSGTARAQDKMPAVGSIPGVDNSTLQQHIEAYQKEIQDLKNGKGRIKIILPSKKQETLGRKEATETMKAFWSKKMQQKIHAEETKIFKQNLPKKKTPFLISPQQAPFKLQQPVRHLGGTVFMFLSSSMPEDTIHTYLSQAALCGEGGIVPVFYGFPGGLSNKIAAGRYFIRLLQHDLDCKDKQGSICPRYRVKMLVNPDIFKKFGVTVVPTVVYATAKNSWKMEGDASLGYILERINKRAKSRYLDRLVKKLSGENEDQ